MNRKIAVVGLGYVGLPVAVAFGQRFPVLGFDVKARRIAELRAWVDSTHEVAADALHAAQVQYSDDPLRLRECDFFIVAVPTPVDEANKPDLSPLVAASRSVGAALKPGAIVVYESTVYPGATEEDCVPVLEAASGLKHGADFFVGYSPERINPGDREHTFTKVRKIVSACDAATLDIVASVYETVVEAGVHRAPTIRVAEAAKVIENTQRDLNIALMNELAVLFKRMGIDTQDVLEAAGSKWNFLPFRPGLVGGHCIGVDPYYLTYKAEQLGYIPQVILAGRRINDNMGRFVARNLVKLMLQQGIDVARSRVGVMGITFKEDCPDVRNSKAVDIVRELQDHGIEVVIADPVAQDPELAAEHGLALGRLDAEHPVDALVVAVSHRAYRAMTPQALRGLLRGERPVLADVKSIVPRAALEESGVTVWRLLSTLPITDRRIRFALVGCGRISRNHFDALARHASHAELAAVCDNDPAALAKAVAATGAAGFASLDALLAGCDADVVVLTTPSGLHPRQAIRVAHAGRHVITEKPMATKFDEGMAMVRACRDAGVKLFVVKQNRLNATMQLLKRAIDSGRFGRIHMANVNVFWTRPQSYYDDAPWRGRWDLDGGAFMNQASHYVDMVDWLIGPVDNVHAYTATLARDIEAEDSGVMSLRLRSGALASINVTMLTHGKNFEGSITLLGEHGTVRVGGVAINEIQHWEFAHPLPEDEQVRTASYAAPSVYGFGHPLYYENVIETLRGRAHAEVDGYEGLRSLEVIIAAYRSARDGVRVGLPLVF